MTNTVPQGFAFKLHYSTQKTVKSLEFCSCESSALPPCRKLLWPGQPTQTGTT